MNLRERNENMKDFFNKKIDTYDDVHSKFMTTKKGITDVLDNTPKKVLDLGAGTGLELIYLFEKYPECQVTAVDISENMLEKLKLREFSDKVTTICGDFFEVDFGCDYDAVISTSALHHFLKEDKVRLYQKIYDALKVEGEFINSDKVANTCDEEKLLIDDYYENKDVKVHIDTPLTVESEIEILESVGFTNIEVMEADTENYKLIRAKK